MALQLNRTTLFEYVVVVSVGDGKLVQQLVVELEVTKRRLQPLEMLPKS
jgi:hypothetical protein